MSFLKLFRSFKRSQQTATQTQDYPLPYRINFSRQLTLSNNAIQVAAARRLYTVPHNMVYIIDNVWLRSILQTDGGNAWPWISVSLNNGLPGTTVGVLMQTFVRDTAVMGQTQESFGEATFPFGYIIPEDHVLWLQGNNADSWVAYGIHGWVGVPELPYTIFSNEFTG